MNFDEYTAAMNGTPADQFVDANKLVEWLNAVRTDWHNDWDFQKVYAVDYILTHLHAAIDHTREYVRGAIHTNGLENFWSLLKRSLKGTYVAVAPFHLQRYTAEQAFRFNARTGNDAGRFEAAMGGTIGKRLTYRVLTQQDDAGFMGIV